MGFKGKSISIASYDAGNRLTAWNRAGADENHNQTWDYDDAGNWNSTTKDGDTEGRNHSVSNQITQLDGKAVSHDLKGNLTDYEYDRTDYRVKYDLDNRIVEVKADSETIRYRYDALGRRIVNKGDDETVLIWWGDSECAEYEHRASKDAIQNDIMGHPTRLNSVIARDTEDRENRVELQWYHKNYLDHVYAVSDDNGNLIEHYRYTAFGEPEIYSPTGARRNTSTIGNTVMWNTRRYDADNGLYYYKYRHYAANIGRWLGRDPIKENGGINLYAFVGNDPAGRWDRLGLKKLSFWEQDKTCLKACNEKVDLFTKWEHFELVKLDALYRRTMTQYRPDECILLGDPLQRAGCHKAEALARTLADTLYDALFSTFFATIQTADKLAKASCLWGCRCFEFEGCCDTIEYSPDLEEVKPSSLYRTAYKAGTKMIDVAVDPYKDLWKPKRPNQPKPK